MKKVFSVLLAAVLICTAFAGCSKNKNKSLIAEEYSDTALIIGYTEEAEPFIKAGKNGDATGFIPDLWKAIFDNVKGDLKQYRFEKIEAGYKLEDDGGFFDKDKKEYSAGLLMGAVSKNNGTFNEDYSFSEPIVTNRVIAVTAKNSKVKTYADFKGAKAVVTNETAKTAFEKNAAISSVCAKTEENNDVAKALADLDSGKADVVITDEFSFNPLENKDNYAVLSGELDTIEYVIACAKYSGWKDSINEAIRELKSEDYGKDDFTPLVEKYFGYNASSFNYVTEGDK